ncbi:MAG: YbbR-like domain-containing protein [Candidatus Omnitrophota bacterium]
MKWLTSNWGLKVISLLIAVGLWYYAVSEESIEVRRSIPLEIIAQNPKMSVLKASADHVWVVFSGPRNITADLTSKDIRAVHYIGQEVSSPGDYSFRLESREIQLPSLEIQVVKIYPETIQVTMDELITQKLKVKPDFIGEPAFGYKIHDQGIQMDPNAVLVEGPKGQVSQIEAVLTEPIDLVGRIRSFRRTVDLEFPSGIRPLGETAVDLSVPIEEEFSEKSFQDIPVKVLQPPDKNWTLLLEPEVISFVLKGSATKLEEITPDKIQAYVDLTDLRRGKHQIEVRIALPEGVILKEAVTVMVTIDKPA